LQGHWPIIGFSGGLDKRGPQKAAKGKQAVEVYNQHSRNGVAAIGPWAQGLIREKQKTGSRYGSPVFLGFFTEAYFKLPADAPSPSSNWFVRRRPAYLVSVVPAAPGALGAAGALVSAAAELVLVAVVDEPVPVAEPSFELGLWLQAVSKPTAANNRTNFFIVVFPS
jgi:hypothetical protein